jgi:hypothetical protein
MSPPAGMIVGWVDTPPPFSALKRRESDLLGDCAPDDELARFEHRGHDVAAADADGTTPPDWNPSKPLQEPLGEAVALAAASAGCRGAGRS